MYRFTCCVHSETEHKPWDIEPIHMQFISLVWQQASVQHSVASSRIPRKNQSKQIIWSLNLRYYCWMLELGFRFLTLILWHYWTRKNKLSKTTYCCLLKKKQIGWYHHMGFALLNCKTSIVKQKAISKWPLYSFEGHCGKRTPYKGSFQITNDFVFQCSKCVPNSHIMRPYCPAPSRVPTSNALPFVMSRVGKKGCSLLHTCIWQTLSPKVTYIGFWELILLVLVFPANQTHDRERK